MDGLSATAVDISQQNANTEGATSPSNNNESTAQRAQATENEQVTGMQSFNPPYGKPESSDVKSQGTPFGQ
jgi:hypothetical protein